MRTAMATKPQTLAPGALAERERVLRILPADESEIRAQGVTRLRLFGSMARGEAGPMSDVDLIADIDRGVSFARKGDARMRHVAHRQRVDQVRALPCRGARSRGASAIRPGRSSQPRMPPRPAAPSKR
jgi:predicted nucleotidyltransferase